MVVEHGNETLLDRPVMVQPGKPFGLAVPRTADRKGVLLLENMRENAVVEVDGKRVPVSSTAGSPLKKLEISPGTHGVLVKEGNDVLLGESVTLESGSQVTLRVRDRTALVR